MQTININDDNAACQNCGSPLSVLHDISFEKEWKSDSRSRREKCHCKHCGTQFILIYDLFDPKGHVYPQVFSGDVNNPNFNWPDLLTDAQKIEIAKHLEGCQDCKERLSEEILSDAWLADILNKMRQGSDISP